RTFFNAVRRRERNWRFCSRVFRLCRCAFSAGACEATESLTSRTPHHKKAFTLQPFPRTYCDFAAVDDLAFRVDAGEIVGLIGPNGAGKTTTLRGLAGILRPTSGTVTIDGHDIVSDPIEAKRRLAFMPDEPHLFEYLTVAEHLR